MTKLLAFCVFAILLNCPVVAADSVLLGSTPVQPSQLTGDAGISWNPFRSWVFGASGGPVFFSDTVGLHLGAACSTVALSGPDFEGLLGVGFNYR